MRTYKYIIGSLLLCMCMAVLWGCSSDELGDEGTTDGQRLSVAVCDGGYDSATGNGQTKAVEQGYETEFTAGDRIGVFAVRGGSVIAEVNNLCLTASIDGGNLVWQDSNGDSPLKFDGAVYYAYYPYQPSLTGSVDATASNAAGFFADVVSNWSPASDQSTYAKYTAQDLMIAQGGILNNVLSFDMKHQMALAVIESPRYEYSFSNSPAISNYTTDPINMIFDGYTPYRMADGKYHYLVKPNHTDKITGGYTDILLDKIKGWEITPNIDGGKYKTFKIDGGLIPISGYTLQPGDFMLKDGSLISKDDGASLTAVQKANCIGIVFWVGDPTKGDHYNGTTFSDFGDPALKTDHSSCTHGLVVALQNASTNAIKWQDPYRDIGPWTSSNPPYINIATGTGATDNLNKLRGYSNTKAIRAYNANGTTNNDDFSKVLAVEAVDTWISANSYPAPIGSSGWYLPSEKELTLLCGTDVNNIWLNNSGGTTMRDLVNGSITNVGSSAATIANNTYWSSSEYAYLSLNAFRVNFYSGYVFDNGKDNPDRVRCVQAF